MDITIKPQKLHGCIQAIPSKSQAHRLLICAAFAQNTSLLLCPESNRDIEATVNCLCALGADIQRTKQGYEVNPVKKLPSHARLDCDESGSTLRFMLPVAGALGIDCSFLMAGRLPQRPLSPLKEEMARNGCSINKIRENLICCQGALKPGAYRIDAGISSQFVSGLLFALALLPQQSSLQLLGKTESRPYIEMTVKALELFGQKISCTDNIYTLNPSPLISPGIIEVEGDWSNAAFWLTAKALGSDLEIGGLVENSPQGDRACIGLLAKLSQYQVIDAADIPDLVPVLAVMAGANQGASFINAGRLRLKETDRLLTTAALINDLGGKAQIDGDTLIVKGGGYTGGRVMAAGDHRIAMAAAVAATVCTQPVTVIGAESVNKSYPAFWQDYQKSGGCI